MCGAEFRGFPVWEGEKLGEMSLFGYSVKDSSQAVTRKRKYQVSLTPK